MREDIDLTKDKVLEALMPIEDPDLGFNIIDLGLVYDVHIDEGDVGVDMTFTDMVFPEGESLYEMVEQMVRRIEGVKQAKVTLVLEPPWSKERINPSILPALEA